MQAFEVKTLRAAEDTGERLWNMARDAAYGAHLAYCHNPASPVYAWYRPSGPGQWGRVVIGGEVLEAEGWERITMGTPRGNVHANQTVECNAAEILEALRRLPLLPV